MSRRRRPNQNVRRHHHLSSRRRRRRQLREIIGTGLRAAFHFQKGDCSSLVRELIVQGKPWYSTIGQSPQSSSASVL